MLFKQEFSGSTCQNLLKGLAIFIKFCALNYFFLKKEVYVLFSIFPVSMGFN